MKDVTRKARLLRKNQTEAERIIWAHVRAKKLGITFVRQKPLIIEFQHRKREFIADFYCRKAKLIIEVDGDIHESQKEYDELRSHLINNLGISVIRFSNDQVINDSNTVVKKIKEKLLVLNSTK